MAEGKASAAASLDDGGVMNESPISNGFWGEFVLTSILILVLLASVFAVVYTAHWNRQLVHDLAELDRERDRLQVEWGQLLLEESAWGSQARIEQEARERLNLNAPTPDQVIVVQ